ncbi:hypothetical protein [Parapedobacter tibetensis]|uniref:hypothetical protein n=2 Tax=Parapedobacter tibetensis TaxID=2972951 RepID=UPI00215217A8|nr:hypothetical protein [Parapedobacter tibetensis]
MQAPWALTMLPLSSNQGTPFRMMAALALPSCAWLKNGAVRYKIEINNASNGSWNGEITRSSIR